MKTKIIRTRQLTLFVLLLLVSTFTLSCGPEEQSSRPADLGAATVRWATWDRSSAAEIFLIDQFREQYPQIEFQREELDGPTLNLLESNPPDLLNMDIGNEFQLAVQQSQLADLTELWQQTGLAEQVPATLRSLSERDGKQYYVPFGFGWVGFYYNKQIFADYGLQPPQTWEEFIQICETLALNGETPLAIAGAEPWSSYEWFEYLDLRLNGPAFHRGLMSGRESFEDARVRNVVEQWKSLFDLGYFAEESKLLQGLTMLTTIVRSENKAMVTRVDAVMALSDAFTASQLPAPFMQQLGYFRFPIIDPSLPVAETINAFGYVIPVGANNPSHAIAFLTELSSAKSQLVVAQQGLFSSVTYAPARMDVDATGMRFDQVGALESIKQANETVPYMWLTLPRETWGMMTYYFTRFVGDRDVDTFITKLEAARQTGLKKGVLSGE